MGNFNFCHVLFLLLLHVQEGELSLGVPGHELQSIQSIKSRSRAQQSHWVYGHTAHGVAHLIKKDDWARVQLTEGVLPPFTQILQVG